MSTLVFCILFLILRQTKIRLVHDVHPSPRVGAGKRITYHVNTLKQNRHVVLSSSYTEHIIKERHAITQLVT